MYPENKLKVVKAQEIFDQIKAKSGRLDKEKILRENKDNKTFVEMLVFLYNPFIVTGIGKKKYQKFAEFTGEKVQNFESISEVLEYLKENNTGKEENIKAIANYVNSFSGRTKDFLQEYFTDDVKIGVTDKTINKVYGKDTIPTFNVMLAESLNDHIDYVDGKEHVTLMKYDGVRCTAIKDNNKVRFLSRNGNPYIEMVELEELFKLMPNGYVIEGEVIVSNYNELSSKECYKKSSKIVRTDGEKKGLMFMAFDFLPLVEFNAGQSKLGYIDRLTALQGLQESLVAENKDNDLIKLFDVAKVLYVGDDISVTLKMSKDVIDNGQEGLVIRKANSIYVTKRSKGLLRIKGIETADLKIVDVEEGTKESTKGKLGAIVVEYKGYRVNVGSGFTKEERVTLWEQRNDLIGQVAEVMYTEESSNEQGELSLRFPRFKGLRPDKIEADF